MRSLLLLFALVVATATARDSKPNIIFILADDLGYGQIGPFGQKTIATPNLDRMAAEGTKFTRFYAGSPVCAPSRSVLMTGQHTGHTRVRGNAGKQNRDAQNLRAKDRIIPEILKSAGYATALIGKWGVGHEGSKGLPNDKGFDYFFGYLDQTHAHNPYPEWIMRNKERVALRNKLAPEVPQNQRQNGAGWTVEKQDYVPDMMADEALEWVRQHREQPFFLYWSLITPHANNEATRATGNGMEVPDLGPYAEKDWPAPDKGVAAVITRLDRDIGRMFELLKELGVDQDTLVMFSSDNGHHREGGNNPERFDDNGPLRGMKRTLYEGGVRAPTIARWPGKIAAGSTVEAPLWFADLLPTFAELAEAKSEIPERIDGVSFAAALAGKSSEWPAARTFYWEFHEGGFTQGVLMDGRWKAIRAKRRTAPIEIYDVVNDAGETTDLAKQRADLVERAEKLFVSERTESPDWPIREAGHPQ